MGLILQKKQIKLAKLFCLKHTCLDSEEDAAVFSAFVCFIQSAANSAPLGFAVFSGFNGALVVLFFSVGSFTFFSDDDFEMTGDSLRNDSSDDWVSDGGGAEGVGDLTASLSLTLAWTTLE